MARIKVPRDSFNAKALEKTLSQRCHNYPPCLERIEIPSVRKQFMVSWDHFRRMGNERRMQALIKHLQTSPDAHVSGYRRLRKHKIKKLATTGQYTRGKTHPRYLGMDVK